jgi:hypothetical protein
VVVLKLADVGAINFRRKSKLLLSHFGFQASILQFFPKRHAGSVTSGRLACLLIIAYTCKGEPTMSVEMGRRLAFDGQRSGRLAIG